MNLTTRNKQNGLGIIMYYIYTVHAQKLQGFCKTIGRIFRNQEQQYRKMFVQSSETARRSVCVFCMGGKNIEQRRRKFKTY